MPPRHAYWTIIVDDQPTAFRAHDAEEILAIFNRLRDKHPSAVMKWFERGKLWESREAAREAGGGEGERRWEGPRPDPDAPRESAGPRRDRTWRPGGEHRDPRQKYKDAKKAKWDRFKEKIRGRFDEKQAASGTRDQGPGIRGQGPGIRDQGSGIRHEGHEGPLPPPMPDDGSHTPPHGDPIRPKVKPESGIRGQGSGVRHEEHEGHGSGTRGQVPGTRYEGREGHEGGRREGWKPKGPPRDRSQGAWRPRSEEGGAPPRDRDSRREEWKPRHEGHEGPKARKPTAGVYEGHEGGRREGWKPKPAWKPKPGTRGQVSGTRHEGHEGQEGGRREGWKPKPGGARKPWGSKPGGARKAWDSKPGGARKPWGSKPGGGKSWGAKPSSARKPWSSKPPGAAHPTTHKTRGGGPGGGTGFRGRKKPFGSGPPRGPKKPQDEE